LEIKDDAITSDKIKDGEVKAEDLGADIADEGKVGVVQPGGTIVYENVSSDNVDGKDFTSTDLDITNGTGATLTNVTANIKDGAVTPDKIEKGNDNQVLITDENGDVKWEDQVTADNGLTKTDGN